MSTDSPIVFDVMAIGVNFCRTPRNSIALHCGALFVCLAFKPKREHTQTQFYILVLIIMKKIILMFSVID